VGVHLSTAAFSLDQIKRLIALGMNWILDGADVTLAMHHMQQRRAALCGAVTVRAAPGSRDVALCIAPTTAANGNGAA
jgi:hypothetical protein